MSFWKSPFIKGIENGELPEIETKVSLDVEKTAVIIGILLIAFILGIVAYKQIVK